MSDDLVTLRWCKSCTHGEGVHFDNPTLKTSQCVMCDTCDGFIPGKEERVKRSDIRATANTRKAPEEERGG